MKKLFAVKIFILFYLNVHAQRVVRYDLYVKDTLVNFTGREKRALCKWSIHADSSYRRCM